MFSYTMLADPNISHSGFYVLILMWVGVTITLLIGDRELLGAWPIWGLCIITIGIGYKISYAEWDIPTNTMYRAKFAGFVAEMEIHKGPKNQIKYTNTVYCEYVLEINSQHVLMPCNSGQSPEYVTLYWNKRI